MTADTLAAEAPAGRAGWSRGGTLLVVLLLGHLVVKLLLLPRAVDAPLQGDEVAYFDAARALSNLVRDLVTLDSPDRVELSNNVVGNGWFMPGMAIVLTPLLVLFPDPDLGLVRVYLGLVSLALFALTLRSVDRTFGRPWTLALLVVPGLLPMWALFSFTAWGDHDAGLLAVLLLCQVTAVGRDLLAGRAPGLWRLTAIGAVAAAMLYLRSNTLPLALGMLVLLGLGLMVLAVRGGRGRAAVGITAAVGTFALLLAPWSLAASDALGGRVVATSTVPLSTAVAFGDVDRLCFGSCGPGNIWFASARYSQQVAREARVSELEVQRQMSDYALQDATLGSFAEDVQGNLHRFALEPAGLEPVFREVADSPPDTVSGLITAITRIGYFAALLAAAASLLVVARRRTELQLVGLLLKLGLLAMLVQPFLHVGSPRYWPVFAPLLPLLAMWAWSAARAPYDENPAPSGRWLTGAHVVVAGGVAALAISLVVLGGAA